MEELCEVPRCLLWRGLTHHCPIYNVSCIFFSKCLYFSYYMAGCILDRSHMCSFLEYIVSAATMFCFNRTALRTLQITPVWLILPRPSWWQPPSGESSCTGMHKPTPPTATTSHVWLSLWFQIPLPAHFTRNQKVTKPFEHLLPSANYRILKIKCHIYCSYLGFS